MYNPAASMPLRQIAARAALIGPMCAWAAVLPAGTITGKVELVDKGGRRATDLSDVVVYVDGARVKPRPATATMIMTMIATMTMTATIIATMTIIVGGSTVGNARTT